MTRRVYCLAGCGSTSFRAYRRASIVEDFTVEDDGSIVRGDKLAEGGGRLWLSCAECGRHWASSRDLDLALFLEER